MNALKQALHLEERASELDIEAQGAYNAWQRLQGGAAALRLEAQAIRAELEKKAK